MDQAQIEKSTILNSMKIFLSNKCFQNQNSFYVNDDPFKRPSRPNDFINFLGDNIFSSKIDSSLYLFYNRILNTIYEQDLVLLPKSKFCMDKFNSFYEPNFYTNGQVIRPTLEKNVFGNFENEVSIRGKWDTNKFIEYTQDVLVQINKSESFLYNTISNSQDPESAAKFFLIQCAGDFLSEASAMGRNVIGNFGSHLSELFKILIDEYGYGVHHKKHSTLFEETLKSVDMSSDIHYYWQFYIASSLALTNYFHYISKNHQYIFRYLGAMYFTEASLALISKHQSRTLKHAFGNNFNTTYFDEHDHIDKHHGRMALEDIIIPAIKQYGEDIIPDILRGFEEFKLLQDVADADFAKHIKWHDEIKILNNINSSITMFELDKAQKFIEYRGEVSVMHVHSKDELFYVMSGKLRLIQSPFKYVELSDGQYIIIPNGLIHGTEILSDKCEYCVLDLDDIKCKL